MSKKKRDTDNYPGTPEDMMKFFSDTMSQVKKEVKKMDDDKRRELVRILGKGLAEMDHIKTSDWQRIHPEGLSCGSDRYYVKLVNRLIDKMYETPMPGAPKGTQRFIALSVAAYLEDLVNGFGVWNSFRNMYREIYGTWLPFFDCEHEEYMLDNVNMEDLRYIIWQSCCRCGSVEERMFSPYSPGYELLAKILFDEIVDEFENAPESARISNSIDKCLKSRDFIKTRVIAIWLSIDNPLTAVPFQRDEIENLSDSYCANGIKRDAADYIAITSYAWLDAVGPLGLPVNRWLAAVCREKGMEKEAAIMDGIKTRGWQTYDIVGETHKYLVLKDVTGKEFNLLRNTAQLRELTDRFKGLTVEIVRFNGEWEQNGISLPLEKSDFSDSEKIHYVKEFGPEMKEVVDEVIAAHDGQQVFVGKSIKDVNKIMLGQMNAVALEEFADGDGPKDLALLVSHEATPRIIDDGACFFKIKGNRKYSVRKSKKDGLLLFHQAIPDDVALYIQENHLAPDVQLYASQGEAVGKAVVQENFRFLCGFFRPEIAYNDSDDDYMDDYDDDYDDD